MKKNKLNLNKIEISSLDSAKINDGTMDILGGASGLPKTCAVSIRKTECLCTQINCESILCNKTNGGFSVCYCEAASEVKI